MDVQEAIEVSGEVTMIEVGYHMAADECKQAYATGVLYAGVDVELWPLWAERANHSIIYDGDVPVGFGDACA